MKDDRDDTIDIVLRDLEDSREEVRKLKNAPIIDPTCTFAKKNQCNREFKDKYECFRCAQEVIQKRNKELLASREEVRTKDKRIDALEQFLKKVAQEATLLDFQGSQLFTKEEV